MTTLMFSYFRQEIKDIIFGGAYQTRRTDYDNLHVIITSGLSLAVSLQKFSKTYNSTNKSCYFLMVT